MGSKPTGFAQAIKELDESNPGFSDLRARVEKEYANLQETLEKLKPQVSELKDTVEKHAKNAKNEVESQVQKNPWAAIGIVGLIFFVIGFLLGNKGSRD